MAVRAMAFTAVVARNGLGFFFLGTATVNHKGHEGSQRISEASALSAGTRIGRVEAKFDSFVFLCVLCGYDVSNGRARFF